ncbi:MAG TPA: NAD(+)/NADH kinase [Bacillota bacterium]|nr:NAD(+)/NADH kinase [Bacillota bacterium]
MRFGIVSNSDKDKEYAFAKYAANLLIRKGCEVVVDESYNDTILAYVHGVEIDSYSTCDMIFSMGGDGTFLSTVHRHISNNIPIIGVNLGSIGFLTEIMPDKFEDAIDRILKGEYHLEKRSQLSVQVIDAEGNEKGSGLCLNDAVIARGLYLHVVTLDLFIDHDYVERLSGDGVILSTATGSTAYSLAAGGPIVKPEMDIFLVTPICPHTLHNRSYVVSSDSEVEIRLQKYTDQPILSLDGRMDIKINMGDRIIVHTSKEPIVVVRIGYTNFYQTVRKKIRARGSFYEDGEK